MYHDVHLNASSVTHGMKLISWFDLKGLSENGKIKNA